MAEESGLLHIRYPSKEETQWRRRRSGICDIDKPRDDIAERLSTAINESDPNLEDAFTPAVARQVIAECKEREYRLALINRAATVIREYVRKATGYT